MKKILKIATRKSPLALWQANFVKQKLLQFYPDLPIELVPLVTSGDKFLQDTLSKVGGKGLFTKELENALSQQQADLAVHSMKDLPVKLQDEFIIAAIMTRGTATDALVSRQGETLEEMPPNNVIGTSSLRRICQLKHDYPHLIFKPIRGNVNTRLKKLDEGTVDGLILAQVGLERLQLSHRISQSLQAEQCLPAVGQGVLAIECRCEDQETQQLLQVLQDNRTASMVQAERGMNAALNGGCEVPIAGYCVEQEDQLFLRGMVGKPDGSQLLFASATGKFAEAMALGQRVAQDLLAQGAGDILQAVYDGKR